MLNCECITDLARSRCKHWNWSAQTCEMVKNTVMERRSNLISEVYNMDCMDFMKQFPDKHFNLAIVDPPYGINATNMQMGSNPNRSKNDGFGSGPSVSTASRLKIGRLNKGSGQFKGTILTTKNCDWDFIKPSKEYFIELMRVSKNQIIWGGNYFDLPPTRGIICWDKKQAWENFSQWEMAWTSFDRPASLFRLSNSGGINKEKKIHPTQKPIKLYKWLLSKYANDGDIILDTHLGSGSSRIACWDLGYDFYGTELDETYFIDANDRFRVATSQTMLFK